MSRAHPRGRGGASSARPRWARIGGASPRARGSLLGATVLFEAVGRIPAGAGEPRSHLSALTITGRIPAGAGEPREHPKDEALATAHPRGRGGASDSLDAFVASRGASPRARGSPRNATILRVCVRRIPAGAGEPADDAPAPRKIGASPRARGSPELRPRT